MVPKIHEHNMYVYIYMYYIDITYKCIYVYMYTCIYIYIYIHTHFVDSCIYRYDVDTRACTYACICIYVYTYTHAYLEPRLVATPGVLRVWHRPILLPHGRRRALSATQPKSRSWGRNHKSWPAFRTKRGFIVPSGVSFWLFGLDLHCLKKNQLHSHSTESFALSPCGIWLQKPFCWPSGRPSLKFDQGHHADTLVAEHSLQGHRIESRKSAHSLKLTPVGPAM